MSEKKMSKKGSKKGSEQADAPSRNPDFKGATPADVARALWHHRPENPPSKKKRKE